MGHSPGQTFAQSIVIFFGCTSTISIILRLWSRKLTKNFGCDDLVMIPGWICAVAMTGTTLVYIDELQMEVDRKDLSPDKSQVKGNMYLWIDSMLYTPAMLFVRSSILLFLARLDRTAKVRIWLWVAATWCSLSCLMWFIYFPLKCIPIQRLWDPSVPGVCSNVALINTLGSGLWVFGDLFIAIIPTALCYNLQIPLAKKIGAIILLSLGWLVVAASLLRFVYMFRLYYTDENLIFNMTFLTCHLEATLSVITGSGPHLKPLFLRWYKGVKAFASSRKALHVSLQQQPQPAALHPNSLLRSSRVRGWRFDAPISTLSIVHRSESTEGLREEHEEHEEREEKPWNIKKNTQIVVNDQP